MSSKKIVIANWKMNPESSKKATSLFSFSRELAKKYKTKIVVCPPSTFFSLFPEKKIENFSLGSQDVFYEKKGSYTGEVSTQILKSFGVEYVIIGHSERRSLGETNEIITKKISQALKSNIIPIVCVGEKQRDSEGHFFRFLREEIFASLKSVSKENVKKIIIAYEPVWAISTKSKVAMEGHSINESIIFIKKTLSDKFGNKIASKVRIIYGGSVDGKNIKEIVSVGGCDGVIVGKASLSFLGFESIIKNITQ